MIGTLKLTSVQLRQISRFLELLNEAYKETHVLVTAHSGLAVEIEGDESTNLEFRWQPNVDQYVVEDYPR